MNHWQRMQKVLNLEQPDRVPFSFKLCDAQEEVCERMLGTRDYRTYFDFDVKRGKAGKTKLQTDFRPFHDIKPPEDSWFNEWGVLFVPFEGSYHFAHRYNPMAGFDSPEQFESYPYPDLDAEYRYEHLEAACKEAHEAGYAFGVGASLGPIQTIWNLRGPDNWMVDATVNEDLIRVLYDKIVDLLAAQARLLARCRPDVFYNGDNCATQRGLMVSRQFWRDWYGPAHRRLVDAIHEVSPRTKYYYHADGKCQDVLEDMIEFGINVFDPVQPECMDPAEIKQRVGDRLVLSGGISIQKTMPFGTPEDVTEEVKLRMRTIGKGGGYMISPTHFIEPEVPWENLMAFVEAAKTYGRYE